MPFKEQQIIWQHGSFVKNNTSNKLQATIDSNLKISDKRRAIVAMLSQGARVKPHFFYRIEEVQLTCGLNLLALFFLSEYQLLLSLLCTIEAIMHATFFYQRRMSTSTANNINCFENLKYKKNGFRDTNEQSLSRINEQSKTTGVFIKKPYSTAQHSRPHALLNFLILEKGMPDARLIEDNVHFIDTKAYLANFRDETTLNPTQQYTTLRLFLSSSTYNRDKLVLEKIIIFLAKSRCHKMRQQPGSRFNFR